MNGWRERIIDPVVVVALTATDEQLYSDFLWELHQKRDFLPKPVQDFVITLVLEFEKYQGNVKLTQLQENTLRDLQRKHRPKTNRHPFLTVEQYQQQRSAFGKPRK